MNAEAVQTVINSPAFVLVRERVRSHHDSLKMGTPVTMVSKPHRDFTVYGGALEMWNSTDPQVMLAGPAETGKTIALLHLLDDLAWKHPKLQATIVRKVRADMGSTVLQTWEKKVLYMDGGVTKEGITKHGGEHAEFYEYPNGSRVWVVGLDRPGKALSSERDVIVVNQSEELEEGDWETLASRTTGRSGILSPGRLMGDCNPGPSTHWILAKANAGHMRFIKSAHNDNPVLYDPETGELTAQGRVTMATLDSLTGVRYQRLRLGNWVAAEGVVYETFDRTVHIRDTPFAEIQYHVAGVDWGYTNPGVIQVWGVDGDKRMYRVYEEYRTGKLVAASTSEDAWWIRKALELKEKYKITTFVCDPSEPAYIEAFQRAGLPAVQAFNSVTLGIQNIESRLKVQDDKRPRIVILRGSNCDPDDTLLEAHKAACLEDEMELYSWEKTTSGKPLKEKPKDEHNHACDAMRYAAAYVDNLGDDEFAWAA
jgi:phage terminase large subunit